MANNNGINDIAKQTADQIDEKLKKRLEEERERKDKRMDELEKNVSKLAIRTATGVLKDAIENILKNEDVQSRGKYTNAHDLALLEKTQKIVERYNKKKDEMNKRLNEKSSGEYLEFLNLSKWRSAFDQFRDEDNKGIVSKMYRSKFMSTQEAFIDKNLPSGDEEQQLWKAIDVAKEINKIAGDDEENKKTNDNESTQAVLKQLVKFLSPTDSKQSYNLEQSRENEALNQQKFEAIKSIQDNVVNLVALTTEIRDLTKGTKSGSEGDLSSVAGIGTGLVSTLLGSVDKLGGLALKTVGRAAISLGGIAFKALSSVGPRIVALLAASLKSIGSLLKNIPGFNKIKTIGVDKRGTRALTTKETSKQLPAPDKKPPELRVDKKGEIDNRTDPKHEPIKRVDLVKKKALTMESEIVDVKEVKKDAPSIINKGGKSLMKTAGKFVSRFGAPLAAAASIASTASDISAYNDEIDLKVQNGEITAEQATEMKARNTAVASAKGATEAAGIGAGTMAGAAIGTVLLPGLGTVVGGFLGSLIGDAVSKWATDSETGQQILNSIGDASAGLVKKDAVTAAATNDNIMTPTKQNQQGVKMQTSAQSQKDKPEHVINVTTQNNNTNNVNQAGANSIPVTYNTTDNLNSYHRNYLGENQLIPSY